MPLRYPYKKIEQSDDYLQIDILEYIPPGFETQQDSFALNTSDQTYGPGSKSKILESIFLPMPDNIADSNSADWGSGASMGPLEANAAALAVKGIQEPSKLPERLKGVLGNIEKTLTSGTGQSAAQFGAAAAAVKLLSGGRMPGENYLERGAGITFNQNVEVLFNGLKLRGEFQFDFDLVPRSKTESEMIKTIIRTFKKHSAVKKGADYGEAKGLFLKAPEVFRIRYMSGGKPHPFLHKFKICALTSMTVNYAASGTYATYSDATPVHTTLTLNFQELTPIYHEDYLTTDEKGSDDGIGVGY